MEEAVSKVYECLSRDIILPSKKGKYRIDQFGTLNHIYTNIYLHISRNYRQTNSTVNCRGLNYKEK